MKPLVNIFPTEKKLCSNLTIEICDFINRFSRLGNPLTFCFSGGKTPLLLFQRLSEIASHACKKANWNFVHIFWVDERCVPPDNAESNYGNAWKYFLKIPGLVHSNVHRIKGENDPSLEVKRYSNEILSIVPLKNKLPCFDWIFLGMGEDGHTASIFPGRNELFNTEQICTLEEHPVTGQKRITITGSTINNAHRISFIVTGLNKSTVLKKIIEKNPDAEKYPASHVNPIHGHLQWYIDKKAGNIL